MGREGHCKQIPLVCVGCAHSVWTTLGLPQLTVACAFRVYTAQAPGCIARALSKVSPAVSELPRSKPLRFSGILQGHGTSWACILSPAQVRAAQMIRCLASALSQEGHVSWSSPRSGPLGFLGVPREHCLRYDMCLLWGAALRLRPSWQTSTIQDPRKMWLTTGSLLTVWWKMPLWD